MSSKLLDPGSVPLKRRPGGNVWARLAWIMQFLVGLGMVAGVIACFLPVIRQAQIREAQKAQIDAAIATEQAKNRQLNRQFDLLKTNPEYIERTARDVLNVGKPGEMIFRFDPYPAAKPAAPGSPAAATP